MKKKIHIALHKPTGAKIPVVVRAVDATNVITDYVEHIDNRKGFTVKMLTDRWDKCVEDVLELLHDYEVPAYIDSTKCKDLERDELLFKTAIFFEEYIYAIERREKISHSKLKSKLLARFTDD